MCQRKVKKLSMMALLDLMLLLMTVVSLVKAETGAAAVMAKPGCDDHCGNVSIPYPFGMSRPGCYLNDNFLITCNRSTNKALLGQEDWNILVYEILLVAGELLSDGILSSDCYDEKGNRDLVDFWRGFTFSNTRNKFTAVGCDTKAFIMGSKTPERYYTGGCLSICDSLDDVSNHSCTGIGCCQTSIPKGLNYFDVQVKSFSNHTEILNFNPCSYAFLAEENSYDFSSVDLKDLGHRFDVALVIDWAIGNETCKEARRDPNKYACGKQSYCYDNTNGSGYRCNFSRGYQGNPYLPDGCQDINECLKQELHQCSKQVYCRNTEGNYTCTCPWGLHGDGRKDGTGCTFYPLIIKTSVGIVVVLTLLILGGSWSYWVLRKRKSIKLKEKFFKQNGGLVLQQQLSESVLDGHIVTTKIFTAEELERATNKYSENRILGRGGFGTVYKGILEDERIVAIKRSNVMDKSQIDQFINEVVVLSRINHRNVVKLLGCCLEIEVPLLVYEFINNGTLSDHIHIKGPQYSIISWEVRLRIAAETAGALAYLHSACSVPIIHRDIKPANILLDENYIAKVSDFGASRLIPVDQAQLTTLVQGTLGYLDPEYFQTSYLTEKSDVYSFGVLLVELLTGMKALSFERPEEERNLAMYFILSMKEDQLFQVLVKGFVSEAPNDHLLEVALLAMRCLKLKGEERPNMKEVALELEGLRRSWKQQSINAEQNSEDTYQYQNYEPWDYYSDTAVIYSASNYS